jgi:hypothetical protein
MILKKEMKKMTSNQAKGFKVIERKMGEDEQEMLKQAEKMMDDGIMPHVNLEGNRVMFTQETLDHFNIKSGDAIDINTMGELQKFQMGMFPRNN